MGIKRTLGKHLAAPARAYVRHAPAKLGKRVLTQQLLEPALRGAPRSFVAQTVDGFVLTGDTADMIQRYVYVFGVWEPAITAFLRRRLRPGRTLIDVGANIGYFSLLGAKLVGSTGSVVAVEAFPSTFELLQRNLARNDARNVRAVHIAATAQAGVVPLYNPELHNTGTATTVAAEGLELLAEVEARPLADVLTPDEVASARIIKIDVEGAEFDVLRGLDSVLPQMPEDLELVVEVSPEEQAAGAADAPLELLAGHGFVPYRIMNDYSLASYVEAAPAGPPVRFHGPLTERMDLVFSRTDADVLP